MYSIITDSINRTKVELKFSPGIWGQKRSGNYQSYQSGIEMWDKVDFIAELQNYQSYQSGIEIH